MKTNTNNQVSNLVQVGKAVLNDKAVERLEEFQESDNSNIDRKIQGCCDIICFFASNLYMFEEEQKPEVMEYLQFLANVKEDYKILRKP